MSKNYKAKEFAELLNVSVLTLQRWDNTGKLKAHRTPTNRRYYTYEQYQKYMGITNSSKKTVIYTRVSTSNQKDDLKNQVEFLRQYANAKGIIVDTVIEDYGSGLNYNRKQWNKLIDECMTNEIGTIIITHKDRFIRFGFDWFEKFLNKFGVKFIIVNNESLSPQEELVQDIISILDVFSCRIYGLRKYKKKIKEDIEVEKSIQNRDKANTKADRYYVSVIVDIDAPIIKNTNKGIGIDLGLKDFAICSDGNIYKNINKTQRIRKLEKKLKREQKRLSRKYEFLKKRGGTATKSNINKKIVKVQKLHHRLDNIRTDYINKTISRIVNQKPKFITIEDLNVKGMMKNKHLSKAVAEQKFYEFRNKLTTKCNALGIELRIVDRFYPSSKLCHCCGSIKKDLKLKDRIYKCECGYIEDRDYNASLNLRDCLTYKIAQ